MSNDSQRSGPRGICSNELNRLAYCCDNIIAKITAIIKTATPLIIRTFVNTGVLSFMRASVSIEKDFGFFITPNSENYQYKIMNFRSPSLINFFYITRSIAPHLKCIPALRLPARLWIRLPQPQVLCLRHIP